jgi:hypothetical protein
MEKKKEKRYSPPSLNLGLECCWNLGLRIGSGVLEESLEKEEEDEKPKWFSLTMELK